MEILLLAVEDLYKDSEEPQPATSQQSTLKKKVRSSQGPQSKFIIVLPRIMFYQRHYLASCLYKRIGSEVLATFTFENLMIILEWNFLVMPIKYV